jgi:acetyl-CoA synthetase
MRNNKFPPPDSFASNAHISSMDQYHEQYKQSIDDPEDFWADKAERLEWSKKWSKVRSFDFVSGEISWFENGKLNVSQNCLDRHVDGGHGDRPAIIWEGNDPNEDQTFTYSELLYEVKKFSNVLKSNGIEKGDRVCFYLQMVPQLAIAMLACTRIGAVHSIVFGAFSADSLRECLS